MSAALIRRWFEEVWNQRRLSTVDELLDAGTIAHGLPGAPRGPAGFRAFHAQFVAAFPDVRVVVEEAFESPPAADGSVSVACRFTAHVTSPRSGEAGALPCMSMTRWRGGTCVEARDVCDFHELEEQVGPLPS